MNAPQRPISILLVEDNEIDALMVVRAAASTSLAGCITVVDNGDDALAYLRGTGGYDSVTPPHLVVLDLNLPGINGHEVLREMKADEALRRIPVVVLTTSTLKEDVLASYDANAAAFITKPVGLAGVVKVVEAIECFWLQVATLPSSLGPTR